ncbi:MAG TPA: DUF3606 domain-containing protein [Xanthobacteraceae bacterium]|jgi:hypothetical protein|nr:DUF3606 domain-containing protein [Xanthobacteraceae bacterium]
MALGRKKASRKKASTKKASKKKAGKKVAASKRGRKADRSKVSGKQPYEIYYVARKFGVRPDDVRQVIKKVGNSREKIYAALEKM